MPEMSNQYVGDGNRDVLSQDRPDGCHPPVPPQPESVKTWTSSPPKTTHSDGSTASYYELPPDDPKELQDLISYRDMNGQIAEIFRAAYRYGQVAHSPKLRDAKKILFYAMAEVARLEKYGE